MYPYVLIAHGLWRWAVLLAGAGALVSAFRGLRQAETWPAQAARSGRLFGIAVDIQFLLGASLYLVFSPVTTEAVSVADTLPAGSDLRFFAVYHAIAMTLAFIVVHGCAIFVRRGRSDRAKHRRSLIGYGLTLLLIVCAVPWWRPWVHL